MHFIDILRVLPVNDLDKFLLFLQSPYFTTNEKALKVYQYLLPFFKKQEAEIKKEGRNFERHKLIQLFWKGDSCGTNLDGVYTHLKSLLCKYLSIEYRQNSEREELFTLLRFFKKTNGLEANVLDIIADIKKKLPQQVYCLEDLYAHFHLRKEEYSYALLVSSPKEYKALFLKLLPALKQYIAIMYLKYALEVQNKERIYGKNSFARYFPLNLLHRILTLIELNQLDRNVPVVKLYYYLGKCLLSLEQANIAVNNPVRLAQFQQAEAGYFADLQRLLFRCMRENLPPAAKTDMIDVFYAARNYLIRKVQESSTNDYLQKIARWNAEAENTGLFLENGFLLPSHYLNNIKVGIYIALTFAGHIQAQNIAYQHLGIYRNNNRHKIPQKYATFIDGIVQGWFYVYDCLPLCPIPLSRSFIASIGREKINVPIELYRRVLIMQLNFLLLAAKLHVYKGLPLHDEAQRNSCVYEMFLDIDAIASDSAAFNNYLSNHQAEISKDSKTSNEHFVEALKKLCKIVEAIMNGNPIKNQAQIYNDWDRRAYLLVEKKWLLKELAKL